MNPLSIDEIMNKYFRDIPEFRDIQEKVIENVRHRNTLCLMPTGGGKSLIYQVAGLMTGKTTLVISPLLALMDQHYGQMREKGLDSLFFHGGIDVKQQFEMLKKFFHSGAQKFIFTSPERLQFDGYFDYVLFHRRKDIGLVVIDEAHCVSQWGHSFRPSYKSVPDFLKAVFGSQNPVPVLCLTATLNPHDQAEILSDFNIAEKDVFRSPILMRENISLSFEALESEDAKLIRLEELLRKHSNDKIIVYAHRKNGKYGTKSLTEHFKETGFSCERFDADCSENHKETCFNDFMKGNIKIIFATNAFGMGVDIPDIRVIIHYLIPESVEQYYQEVGRSGRDGNQAFAYLLFSKVNVKVRRDMINSSFPSQKQINETFDEKLKIQGSNTISSLNPWLDMSEDNGELVIFQNLVRYGVINPICKGIRQTKCLSVKKTFDDPTFISYLSSTKIGSLITICKKHGISITRLVERIYDLYTNDFLSFNSSPSKCVFYGESMKLGEDILVSIYSEFNERKKYRMENFDTLVDLVETAATSNIEPETEISKHLGIVKS